jgi:ethanolamine transporter EutH
VRWYRLVIVVAPLVVGVVIVAAMMPVTCYYPGNPNGCTTDYRLEVTIPIAAVSVLVAVGLWFVTRRRGPS